MNRKKIVLKSSVIEILSQLISALILLLLRNAFVKKLGIDYVGLNVVIADVLSMLSLAELGFQNAIIFRLYKPIVEDDKQTIEKILSILKKVYFGIGAIILIIGLMIIPFLNTYINNIDVPFSTIRLVYIISLLSTVSTYFFGYKKTFLYANQEQYVITSVNMFLELLFGLLRLAVIYKYSNYIYYALLGLAKNILSDLLISHYCDKNYIFNIDINNNDKEISNYLYLDSKNVLIIKLAVFCYSSIDTLIISRVIGTNTVGYVSNYLSITSNITNIGSKLFMTMAPIVGLYLAEKTKKEAYTLLGNYTFIRYLVAIILFIPTLLLSDDFICMWVGVEYKLSYSRYLLVIILADKYISLVHTPLSEYDEGLGYFSDLKKVLIIGSIFKLVFGIIGANTIGVIGVYVSTVITQIIFWAGRSKILFKNYFDKDQKEKYWRKQLLYLVNIVLVYFLCSILLDAINIEPGIISFIFKGLVCVLVIFFELLIVFGRSEEYNYFLNIIKDYIKKITRKTIKTGMK